MNKKTPAIAALVLFSVLIAAVLIVSSVSASPVIDQTPNIVLQGEYLTSAQIRAADTIGIGISLEFVGDYERIKYFSGSTYLTDFDKEYQLQERP